MAEEIFKPTDATKALMKTMPVNEFFALAESEASDFRKAGSIMAHRYIFAGAKLAVFGARLAGIIPNRDLWLIACAVDFDDAMNAVEKAVGITEKEAADGQ